MIYISGVVTGRRVFNCLESGREHVGILWVFCA